MNPTEIYSPDWLTARILKFRDDFESNLASKVPALLGEKFLSAVVVMVSFAMLSLPSPLNHFHLYFVFSFFIGIYLLILSPRLSTHRLAYLTLWLGCLLTFTCPTGGPAAFVTVFSAYISLWLTFYFAKNASVPKKTWTAIGVSAALYLIFSFLVEGPSQMTTLQLLRPQRFLFVILFTLLSVPLANPNTKTLALRQIFFPLNFVYQTPFILTNWEMSPTQWKTKIRGFIDVLIATVFFFIFYFSSKVPFVASNYADYPLLGFYSYLETYILSCASISLPVGLGRMFGFNLDDAYVLPLLASSPFERWRRWNTYYYRFYSVLIFMPLARKMKMLFLPILATFAVTILFHSFTRNLAEIAYGRTQTLAMGVVWFFLAHGLAVYVSIKWKFKIYDGGLKKGWVGVLVTWLMMIAIHTLNRWGEN